MKNINSYLFILLSLFSFYSLNGQDYTSYFTGNATDLNTNPFGGICLMGGATESDPAMEWLLQRANGGDVLVLRASGSDGYNNYLYSQLGVTVNSVETIVFHNANASSDPYIHQKIAQAEVIWMAGGDQWDYVSYWRNTPIDSLINDGLQNRKMAIGGTSAGMAVLGHWYFAAQNGGTTSNTALGNPYHSSVIVDTLPFLNTPFLENVITDTHYDDRDRKGRHVAFLARAMTDWGIEGKGIACDEYTAVCIDTSGIAIAFGEHPTYDDNVYFLQVNCENADPTPENCTNGQPLNWNLGGDAVKVYHMKGTVNGSQSFDLNTWENGVGGVWEHWYIDNGVFQEGAGSAINCTMVSTKNIVDPELSILNNPIIDGILRIEKLENVNEIEIYHINGKLMKTLFFNNKNQDVIDVSGLHSGVYLLKSGLFTQKVVIVN